MSGADHYEVLNVERTATTAEIKSAYRRLVRQVHPDQGGNAALFRLVQEAWTTLSDPQKRAAYDRTLNGQPVSEERPEPAPESSAEESRTAYDEQPEPDGQFTDSRPYDGSPRPVRVVPRFGRWRVLALLTLTAWLVLTVGPYLSSSLRDGWSITVGALLVTLVVVALPPHWHRRLPFRRRITGCGVLLVILLVVVTLPFANNDLDTAERVWIYAVVAGLVLVRVIGGRWSAARELDQAIDKQSAYDANVWGRPGEPLVDDGYTPPLAGPDLLRHRRTAQILEDVVIRLPAAKLIHGARVGGLTVDHLILAGGRVAVVSSVMWPAGAYTFDVYGSVLRNGQPFGGHDPGLHGVVDAWRVRLKQAEVRGFLIVRPDGQGAITVERGREDAVTAVTARSAVVDLTSWLQPQGDVLDRRLLYDVLYRAPLDLR